MLKVWRLMTVEAGMVSQGGGASGRGPDGTMLPSLLSLGRDGEVPRGIWTWTWLCKVVWAFCSRVEARPPGIEELIFSSLAKTPVAVYLWDPQAKNFNFC